MTDLEPGLYDELITEGLRARLDALKAEGRAFTERRVDPVEQPEALAHYVSDTLRRVLTLVAPENRLAATNAVLELVASFAPSADALVDEVASGLVELHAIDPDPLSGIQFVRPQIPLRRTELLVNDRGEPALAHEIAAELTSADGVDLLCAFVKWYGLRLVIEPIEALVSRGIPVRVITTTYVGATERRALDELVRVGAEVKVSYETQRTRLHAKAWLFRRRSGLDTAYVGSSNLSRSAMLDGLEWNVRLSRVENPSLLDKFAATFDSYWADANFESYDPARDGDRLDEALGRAFRREPLQLAGLDVRPFPFQAEILEQLDAERKIHDRWRNLVVAATGTGKTVISALDYKRLRSELGGDPTLLFVAHRLEILEQSLATFASVLNDGSFGELFVAKAKPEQWRHVFASVQSLSAKGISSIPADHFDVVIIDEFHHAEAATYRRLLDHLQPKVLLGLTATPERSDGQDVTRWFGGRIAAELRIWDALEQELLCPFHYFGVADSTDLSAIAWRRGGYDPSELDRLYTGNDARARLVLAQLEAKVPDVQRMRALGFCVSKSHAAFMARVFNEAGIRARAVDADTPLAERIDARRRLALGELQAIFCVDIFNEGLDVPEVDTILFLRPTESVTVFLQQLGRGLRNSQGKACVTVLDFIGAQHRRFRFDLRFRALTGSSRRTIERNLTEGFPYLPSGCNIDLDRVATRNVLDSLRSQLRISRRELASEVRDYGEGDLARFLEDSGRDLSDVYRANGSWTALTRAAAVDAEPADPDEQRLLRRIHRLCAVDDVERATTWSEWFSSDRAPDIASLDVRKSRLASMLFFTWWPNGGGHTSIQAGLDELWRWSTLRREAVELLAIAQNRISHVPLELRIEGFAHVPLWVHCRYSREELLAALGHATLERRPATDVQGVRYVDALRSDVFTFTLQKSERDYSPTTMYSDYAISPELVHWESQGATSVESTTGQRYLNHRTRGTHVLLFARETNDDDIGTRSFIFLGPASYVSHVSSRPIAITWRLDTPMPADFYASARVLAS